MKKHYIFPFNPELFDIKNNLSEAGTIIWRKTSDIACGDFVYIYVGKTLREIKYKFEVVNTEISDEKIIENSYAIPKGKIASKCSYLEMKIVKTYKNGTFPLKELRYNGMGQFMVPMRANSALEQYLTKKDANAKEENDG